MKYKLVVITIGCLLTFESAYSVGNTEATLRGEDISAAALSVEHFTRPDGLIEHVYTINHPAESKDEIWWW